MSIANKYAPGSGAADPLDPDTFGPAQRRRRGVITLKLAALAVAMWIGGIELARLLGLTGATALIAGYAVGRFVEFIISDLGSVRGRKP